MLNIILTLAISATISLFMTPVMVLLAKKYNIYDVPNDRKIHIGATPLLGGLAIYMSLIITVLLFSSHQSPMIKYAVVIGATFIEILALIDDIKNLKARVRIVIIILLATVIFFSFYYFYFTWEALRASLCLQILLGVVVILWITGIINAINFTDGIDGLASYFSLISLFAFSIILSMQNRFEFALVVNMAAIGGVIGFIPYNRHKALIFMGDAGSMLLGFIIGILSLISVTAADNILYAIVPIYILLLPLMELVTSVLRRLIFKKPIFKADKYHFHHLLSNKIDDHLIVVVILSLIQVVFAVFGVLIYVFEIYIVGLVVLCIVIITSLFLLTKKYIREAKKEEILYMD